MQTVRHLITPVLLLFLLAPASAATLNELIARYHREKGEPYTTRYKTLEEISAVGTERAVRFLVVVIKEDETFAVRMQAIHQLARIPRKSAFTALRKLWENSENNLKPTLLTAMASNRKEPALRKIVEDALKSRNQVLRATLIGWLGKTGDKRFLPEAERFLEDFPRGAASLPAKLTSVRTPDVARILVRIYDDTRKYDRDYVPKVFVFGDKKVKRVLIDALRGDDDMLVANAIALAGRAQLTLAEPELVALLAGAARERRASLIRAIGAVGARTEKGRAAILEAIADKDESTATTAIRAVRRLPGKDAIPHLIRAMDGSKHSVRKEIAITLERITGQQFGDRAGLWRRWWKDYGPEFELDKVRKRDPDAVDLAPVNLAIEKGAAALKSVRGKTPPWKYAVYPVGTSALVCLALHAAGVDPKDPDLRAGVEYLRDATLPDYTYTLALVAMALESIDGKRYKRRIIECARKLISSQKESGLWAYPTGNGDNSNTQYAVLGLRSAARVGMRVPERTWRRVRDHFLGTRRPDGGWAYLPGNTSASSASMTAGGVSSLLICLENMKLKDAEREELVAAIEKGFDTLGKKMKLDKDALYTLYGIERTGVLGRKHKMAGKPWYGPGARRLIAEQDGEGFWRGNYDKTVDTCFAILFLKKATVPIVTRK